VRLFEVDNGHISYILSNEYVNRSLIQGINESTFRAQSTSCHYAFVCFDIDDFGVMVRVPMRTESFRSKMD